MLIRVDASVWGAPALFEPLGEVRTFRGRSVTARKLADAEALVVRSTTRVDARLLAGSRVGFVGTATSGTDHVDTEWLAENGIVFASAPGCNALPVAQYVLAALLLMARRRGFDPREKTLGVVGVGRIGSQVVDWALACGMNVLQCDPPLARRRKDGSFMEAPELLARADLVTLHVPLTYEGPDATRNLVDARWLSSMKPGAILINTSRGDVINEGDLADAIDKHRIGGVVLDVWRHEPCINRRLAESADIVTPHVAGHSVEARRRGAMMIHDALARFSESRAPTAAERVLERPFQSRDRKEAVGVRPRKPLPYGRGSERITASQTTSKSLATLTEAVAAACNLPAIDRALRLALAGPDPAGGFDRLRRMNTARREFAAHRLQGFRLQPRDQAFLARLGFDLHTG